MEREQKRTLILVCAAALCFLAGLIFPEEPAIVKPLFFLLAYLICGAPVILEALKNLFCGKLFDETMLMTLATAGAIALGEYPEAAMVMILFESGEFLEDLAVDQSRARIGKLLDLRPERVRVLRGGKEESADPDKVSAGETILVLPGERVALDGKLLSDHAVLDTSALTGESLPREARFSDEILSGSVCADHAITIRVSAPYGEGTLARILKLAKEAAQSHARRETMIERFARVYTPVVALCALLCALIPILVFRLDAITWIRRALNFLVISCPCALVISIPLTFFSGLGAQSRLGVLVKGAVHIEDLARLSCAVFDKTGTLTRGFFEVSAIHPHALRSETLIDLAALAESYSNHPIARSILRSHEGHIDKSRVKSVKELSGRGIRAEIDGKTVCVGNEKLMEESGAILPDCPHNHEDGKVVHISENGVYCGHIVIRDTLREDAKEAIRQLKSLGVQKTVLLTGDSVASGTAVGKEAQIDEIHCELLPDEKLKILQKLLYEKPDGTLAFIGDGINDAPALTCAELGIAMGAIGSDAAVEAADAVLMNDRLSALSLSVKTARKTLNIARENLCFALGVKFSFLVLSLFGLIPMALAVFADVGVTLLCIANAIRAQRPARS